MRRLTTLMIVALTFGFGSFALAQEDYDAEGGVNWFGDWFDDNGEQAWSFEEDGGGEYYTDDEWFNDNGGVFGFGDTGENWAEDDYGYYDSDYDYDTDEGWFSDWYGDSDEWF